MRDFQDPYKQVYQYLYNAVAMLNIPRKEAVDWQLINIIEKAIDLLETDEYFSY